MSHFIITTTLSGREYCDSYIIKKETEVQRLEASHPNHKAGKMQSQDPLPEKQQNPELTL